MQRCGATLRWEAKARIAELEKAGAAAADGETEGRATGARRFAPQQRASRPKVEKPPLPPDEQRDREIKGLRTRVRNLTQELRAFTQYHKDEMARTGGMPRPTRIALDKVLHPDTRKQATETDKDEACRGWNAWKNSNDKARCQVR
jgi:hypothetical protein